MKKLMKKKMSFLGKEFSVFAIAIVAMMAFSSAALVGYYATDISGTTEVTSPLTIAFGGGTNTFNVVGENAFEESLNAVKITSNVNTVIPTSLVMTISSSATVFEDTIGAEFEKLELVLTGTVEEQCIILNGNYVAAVDAADAYCIDNSIPVNGICVDGNPVIAEVTADVESCDKTLTHTLVRTSDKILTYTIPGLNIPAKVDGIDVDFVLTSQFKLNVAPDTFTFKLQPMTA